VIVFRPWPKSYLGIISVGTECCSNKSSSISRMVLSSPKGTTNKNFTAIASAMTIDPSSKVTFAHKGTTYEIIPYEDISEWLDSIMADLALAV